MGTPINTPFTSELWHLTIDDLLEPLPASPRLGGPGPFVINLSASTAPISLPMKSIAECPGAHVYQVQRTEDRRVRYRLRLGPFMTEAEAEALLPVVREIYPSALAATAEPDDLRAIESIKAKIEAQQLAAVKAAMNKANAASLPTTPRAGVALAPAEPPASPPSHAPAALAEENGPSSPSPPPAWLALRASTRASAAVNAAQPAPEKPAPTMKTPSERPAGAARVAPQAAPESRPLGMTPAGIRPPAILQAAEPASADEFGEREPARTFQDPVIPVLSDVAVSRTPPPPRAAPAAFAPRASMPEPPAPVVVTPTPSSPAPGRMPAATRPMAPMAFRGVTIQRTMQSVTAQRTVQRARVPAAPASPLPPTAAAGTAPAPAIAVQQAEPVPAAAAQAKPPAVPPPRRVEALSEPLSSLDTTQTLRPLTAGEIEDAQALRWFAIQLSLADHRFDPDALPNLDIFSEYRLYSISVTDQGKPMHSLRLGFFAEESAAGAVAGYLGAFYEHPVIKRISVAERERFSAHCLEARKDIGATGKHAVIEITDERVIRPKRTDSATPPSGSQRPFGVPMDKGK